VKIKTKKPTNWPRINNVKKKELTLLKIKQKKKLDLATPKKNGTVTSIVTENSITQKFF